MNSPKKIYKSQDFRGNKIFGAKVETPTEGEHISNKKYVDNSTKFDTAKASQFTISSSFPWLPNLFNKSFKDIFDDLFYPVKNPTYTNPTFKNINIEILDLLNYSGNKAIVYYNNEITLKVNYEITTSDRVSGVVPKILLIYDNGNSDEFTGNNTSDISGEIIISFDFLSNISEIILRKEFQEASVIKQDNYGNDFIPLEFELNYNLDFDVLKYLKNSYEISSPILRYDLTNENYLDIFDDITNISNDNPFVHYNFIKGDKFYLSENDNRYIILIPNEIYKNTNDFECIIGRIKHEIAWEILKNNTSLILDNLIVIGNIHYNFILIDFGNYNISKLCELKFNKIRNIISL